MSMTKLYPARLNIPCTQEMRDWVRKESGGDGYMARFTRELLVEAIAIYVIRNEQEKPETFVLDSEEE